MLKAVGIERGLRVTGSHAASTARSAAAAGS